MAKVVVKKVQQMGTIKELDLTTVSDLQKVVGGYIETIPFPHKILLIVNEEGLLMELPVNFAMGNGQFIVGDVAFCSYEGDEMVGLSDSQLEFLGNILTIKKS